LKLYAFSRSSSFLWPHEVKHSKKLQSSLSSKGMLVSYGRYLHDVVERLWLWLSKMREGTLCGLSFWKKNEKDDTHRSCTAAEKSRQNVPQ
jgi:hypothetical protein